MNNVVIFHLMKKITNWTCLQFLTCGTYAPRLSIYYTQRCLQYAQKYACIFSLFHLQETRHLQSLKKIESFYFFPGHLERVLRRRKWLPNDDVAVLHLFDLRESFSSVWSSQQPWPSVPSQLNLGTAHREAQFGCQEKPLPKLLLALHYCALCFFKRGRKSTSMALHTNTQFHCRLCRPSIFIKRMSERTGISTGVVTC